MFVKFKTTTRACFAGKQDDIRLYQQGKIYHVGNGDPAEEFVTAGVPKELAAKVTADVISGKLSEDLVSIFRDASILDVIRFDAEVLKMMPSAENKMMPPAENKTMSSTLPPTPPLTSPSVTVPSKPKPVGRPKRKK